MMNYHHLSWRRAWEGVADEGYGISEPNGLSSSPLFLYMRKLGLREVELWTPGCQGDMAALLRYEALLTLPGGVPFAVVAAGLPPSSTL